MKTKGITTSKVLTMIALIIAGSVIYELPYLSYQYYDVMLEAFDITDGQMGTLMSLFGIVAVVCYFPGGWIADFFSAKKLLLISLCSTGALGIWFYTLPSYSSLLIIYALWGVTLTLPFWAAMLKATRKLGDSEVQGTLYGILEGGRGLIPIIYGFVIVGLFSKMGGGVEGLKTVLLCYTALNFIGAVCVLFFFREKDNDEDGEKTAIRMKDLLSVMKKPNMWLIAFIIFTTYCLYAAVSYVTPYLTEFCGVSESLAASIGLIRTYGIAILGGLIGGVISDKIGSKARMILYSSIISCIGLITFLVVKPSAESMYVVIVAMLITALGIFMSRGIYFALIDEIEIPIEIGGAAIGFASIIGFIPDAFVYNLIGGWLDEYSGVNAYEMVFKFMLICAAICACLGLVLYLRVKKSRKEKMV